MQTNKRAFTVVELMVVVSVIFLLVVVFLPDGRNGRAKAVRINCVCNLKQVGLAYCLWAGDNNDLNPMQFFTNQTGGPLYADATNAFRYFQVMSNELSTPKVLVCPADSKRRAATNFTTDFAGNHISYFIGLEANETTHPYTLLSGDRNITNGTKPINGLLEVTTNQQLGWTAEFHNGAGNVGLGDGSVQQITTIGLRNLVKNTCLATNRLLFP